jgi:hypothetical protein
VPRSRINCRRPARPEQRSAPLAHRETNAAEQAFWYGVNFEFSYNARHWEEARYAAEVRPILGWRFGPVDLLLNPIIDVSFRQNKKRS